jgi:hypothetical protein
MNKRTAIFIALLIIISILSASIFIAYQSNHNHIDDHGRNHANDDCLVCLILNSVINNHAEMSLCLVALITLVYMIKTTKCINSISLYSKSLFMQKSQLNN